MLPYPDDQIEQIISKEISLAQDQKTVWAPKIYTNVWLLLLERLCSAWQKPDARRAIEALISAELQIVLLSTNPRALYVFQGKGRQTPITAFRACEDALSLVLLASSDWLLSDAAAEISEKLQTAMVRFEQMRMAIERSIATTNKGVGVVGRVFAQAEQCLFWAYSAFMTLEEYTEFTNQLDKALDRLNEFELTLDVSGSAS